MPCLCRKAYVCGFGQLSQQCVRVTLSDSPQSSTPARGRPRARTPIFGVWMQGCGGCSVAQNVPNPHAHNTGERCGAVTYHSGGSTHSSGIRRRCPSVAGCSGSSLLVVAAEVDSVGCSSVCVLRVHVRDVRERRVRGHLRLSGVRRDPGDVLKSVWF